MGSVAYVKLFKTETLNLRQRVKHQYLPRVIGQICVLVSLVLVPVVY